MKFTITLHPVSLLVGAAALGGVLWLVSAQSATFAGHGTSQPLTLGAPIEVKGIPTPGQIVRLSSAEMPYTVPQGRALVVTAFLPKAFYGDTVADLRVDGVAVVSLGHYFSAGYAIGLAQPSLGSGIVIKAGETLTLTQPYAPATPAQNYLLIGYLAP